MAESGRVSSVGVDRNQEWPQYRGDSRHTGRRPGLAAGEPTGLESAWETACESPVGAPVVDRGALYLGSERGLDSFDTDRGTRRFHLETESPVVTPVASADRIVFATREGAVVAVDPVDGSPLWQTAVSALEQQAALTLASGLVIVGTTDGLVALTLESGDRLWTWDGERADESAADAGDEPTADSADEATSSGTTWRTADAGAKPQTANRTGFEATKQDVNLEAIDRQRESASEPAAKRIVGAPAADDERVYAGTTGETVVAVSLETGAEVWTVPTDGTVVGGPTVADDRVYVADDAGTVLALDSETGQTWFTYRPKTTFTTPPTVVGETAFIGGADGYLHVIETTFGNRKLRGLLFSKKGISLDGIPRGSPVIVGETLLIGDTSGWLYGIDIGDDDFAWHTQVDATISGTPAITAAGLFAGFETGTVGRLTWDHRSPYER